MAQNFDEWRDEDFSDESLFDDFAVLDNAEDPFQDDEPAEEGDAFDSLRARSSRAGTMDNEMEEVVTEESRGGGSTSMFALSNFSSGQRIILAVLLLLDVIAIGIGILIVTGRI